MPVLHTSAARPSNTRIRRLLNPAHPFAQGLVAWWLPQPSTFTSNLTWYDLVTSDPADLVGMSQSTPTSGWQPAERQGSYGAIRRVGSTDHVAIKNLFGTRLQGIIATAMMWIHPTSLLGSSVVFDTNTTGNTRQLFFGIDSTKNSGRVGGANNDGTPINFNPLWTISEWQHLVLVLDGTNCITYRNGLQNGTVVGGFGAGFVSTESGTPIQLRLGTNPSGGSSVFIGGYDDVRFYNRVVSDTEIRAIYENSLQGLPGLLQHPRRFWTVATTVSTVTASPAQIEWQASTPSIPHIEGPGQPSIRVFRRPRLRDRLEPGQSVNMAHPLNAGLVAWWLTQPWHIPGDTLYELINNRHGRLKTFGIPSDPRIAFASTSRPGGRAEMRFDGLGDYLSITDVFGAGALVHGLTASVSAWIKPTSLSSAHTLFANEGTLAQRQIYLFLNGGSVGSVAIGGTVGDGILFNPAWTSDEWQHLCLTSDGTTITIYRNGVVCCSQSSPTFFGAGFANFPWVLGNSVSGPTNNLTGQMDDIRLFHTTLLPWQIQGIYETSFRGAVDLLRRSTRIISLPGTHIFGPAQPAKVQWQATTNRIFTPPVVVLQPEARPIVQPHQRFLPHESLRTREPLAQGLLYWWMAQPWEFPGQTWRDLIGGTAAALVNMPATSDGQRGWSPATHPGGRGALGFDGGITDVVVDANAAPHNLERLTISAWINPRSFGLTGKARIVDTMGIAGLAGFFFGLITVEQKVEAIEFNVAGTALLTATTFDHAIIQGMWQHVAVVWDGGFTRPSVTFYVNGMQIDTSPVTGQDGTLPLTLESTNALHIGNRDMLDRSFDGQLDDIRLYDRPLTAQDIFALYSDSLTGALRLLRRPHSFIFLGQPNLVLPATTILLPAQISWQATTGIAFRSVQDIPARMQWVATTLTRAGDTVFAISPTLAQWRVMVSPITGGIPGPNFTGIARIPMIRHWTRKPPLGVRINPSHRLAKYLEACWLFNEGQGNRIHDLATGGNRYIELGLASGAGQRTWTTWEGSPLGTSLRSNGNAGIFNPGTFNIIGNPFFASGSAWTFECWISVGPLNGYPGNIDIALLLTSSASLQQGIKLVLNGAGTAFGIAYFNGPSSPAASSLHTSLPFFQWHHVVVTLSNITGSPGEQRVGFYINGYDDGSASVATSSNLWQRFLNDTSGHSFVGNLGLMRVWNRPLDMREITQLYMHPWAMFVAKPVFAFHRRPPLMVQPAQMLWAAQIPLRVPFVTIIPTQMQWHVSQTIRLGTAQPAQVQWTTQATRIERGVIVLPAKVKWRAPQQSMPVNLSPRDCGPEYDALLAKDFISGDWLIQAPALGLALSMDFNPDGTWEHRIIDISDIEISVPQGGGLASVANVTVSVAEDGRGQSIVRLWEQASAVGAVQVTIDFYVRGATGVLRIFTGHIDSIIVRDAVSQILLVDDSIRKNSLIPQVLTTVEAFANADQAALAKPMPLVYGRGSRLGGAPMLFIDVTTNVYLVAAHPMTLGGKLAVFDQPTNTYLTLETVIYIPNNSTATITLGTVNTASIVATGDNPPEGNQNVAIDGNSATTYGQVAYLLVSAPEFGIAITNRTGLAGWGYLTPGYPQTTTVMMTIANHRRRPGSDPTTTGQFWLRTTNTANTINLRQLFSTPSYNHVTSGQTDVFIISNIAVGINELLNVFLVVTNTGTTFAPSAIYDVGEVSLTPLVAFSANVSTSPTAVGLPINTQELRFNRQSAVFSVYASTGVTNATYAIDGNSLTVAQIGTGTINSNLDGYGELIVTTTPTSAQRANNTVVIDLINHRRSLSSTPTVTGTFSIQSYNTNTGVLLRDNLFTTQQFRHQLNPITTSYTATAINLGANAQLAVRVLAQNEGGAGSAGQVYEVGEIGMETFYQPRGDSSDIFLYGDGYSGRFDPDGSVTGYAELGTGTVLDQPDMIMASIYIQELSMLIDEDAFAAAYSLFANNNIVFDGGLGAGWAVEQANARTILDDIARQSTSLLFPSFSAKWSVRPYRADQASSQSFTVHNILTTDGAERQRPEDRGATMQITLGNLQNVSNHFEVRYAYNPGSRKYDKVWRVEGKTGTSNLPASYVNKSAIENTCNTSYFRYGDLEQLVIDAYWIADDATALYLLNHIATYFSQQRIGLQFETTMVAACLRVGDFITVDYPAIPSTDNGGVFEIHTIRYMPLRGRIQITCSKSATPPQ